MQEPRACLNSMVRMQETRCMKYQIRFRHVSAFSTLEERKGWLSIDFMRHLMALSGRGKTFRKGRKVVVMQARIMDAYGYNIGSKKN